MYEIIATQTKASIHTQVVNTRNLEIILPNEPFTLCNVYLNYRIEVKILA